MTIDSTLFRRVMRRFPTGVAVLTAREGNAIHGMTANAFTSVSLSSTLILVCILKGSTTHDFVMRGHKFAMNFLSGGQGHLARRFARQGLMPPQSFDGVPYHRAVTGATILDGCVAYVDCQVVDAHDAGDHTIFVAEVLEASFGNAREKSPLLWLDGD